MFYRDKHVLVVAGGVEAVEEANYLSELGRVSYFVEKPHDTAGLAEGIVLIKEKPISFAQDGQEILLTTDGGQHRVDGAFVLRPAVAMTQLLPEVQAEKGAIIVDKDLMTTVPGVFAAGDILGAPLQAPKAVGEGNIAAIAAAAYLRALKG
jgi:thioredoxin reductase (NADPH)